MPSLIPKIPQEDSNKVARAIELARGRERYAYDYSWPPEVAMPEKIHAADQWTIEYLLKAVEINIAVVGNGVDATAQVIEEEEKREFGAVLKSALSVENLDESFFAGAQFVSRKSSTERPRSIAEYQNYFGVFEKPPVLQRLNALSGRPSARQRDQLFGWQRIAGVNPMVIHSVTRLPDHFPVTEAHYTRAMGAGDSLAAAAAEGRLFLADYALLDGAAQGVTGGRQKYMTAPLALFAVAKATGSLMPVAIQCTQTPGVGAPIFTPGDGYRWLMAQTFVQVADANIHEAIEHLGCTHLIMGAVCMGMRRQLAESHPLRVLLEPHVKLTFAINNNARSGLVSKGGTVDQIMGGTIEATLGALKAGMDRFSLQDSAPRKALAARGVLDPTGLPVYPYREDAVPVWDAINGFVRAYIALYYKLDSDVAGDIELAAWLDELGSEEGGRLKHLRPVNTLPDLIELMSNIIFIASAQHAAVNFPQYPFMGYVPNMPGAGWAPAPTMDTPDTEAELLLRLPPWNMTTLAADTVWQLSEVRVNYLGKYGITAFSDPRTSPLIRDFRAALEAVEEDIKRRDASRLLPYPFLLPSTIPASINI